MEPQWGTATCLRELKFGDAELLHNLVPKDISGGEKPTPPAVLLIGPGTGLEVNDVVEDMLVSNLGPTI